MNQDQDNTQTVVEADNSAAPAELSAQDKALLTAYEKALQERRNEKFLRENFTRRANGKSKRAGSFTAKKERNNKKGKSR